MVGGSLKGEAGCPIAVVGPVDGDADVAKTDLLPLLIRKKRADGVVEERPEEGFAADEGVDYRVPERVTDLPAVVAVEQNLLGKAGG